MEPQHSHQSQVEYRKLMKPLLERKRRARINSCLDELKELMEFVGGESGQRMARLEKADVLEVTVQHLRSLKARGRLEAEQSLGSSSTFRTGYGACASEVAQFIASPLSGVQQQQAIRIAMTVAEGLRRVQGGHTVPDPDLADRENIHPGPAAQPAAQPASLADTRPSSSLTPLDLSTAVRLRK